MKDIITRKDLGNGLELRVEPSFRFVESDEVDPDSSCKYIREERPQGLDLSLYKDGKLCLSEYDYIKNLKDWNHHITRDSDISTAYELFTNVAQRLAHRIAPDVLRVYEILDLDKAPFDFNLDPPYESILVARTGDFNYHVFFYFCKTIFEPDIVQKFWAHYYNHGVDLGGHYQDRYDGNSFSIYFVDPDKLDEPGDPFGHAAINCHPDWHYNEDLIKQSKAGILALSYGFRMRTFGFDYPSIKTILEDL